MFYDFGFVVVVVGIEVWSRVSCLIQAGITALFENKEKGITVSDEVDDTDNTETIHSESHSNALTVQNLYKTAST